MSSLSGRRGDFDVLISGNPLGTSGDEVRYNCPFCIEVRGKPDKDGKFYLNKKSGVGFCFKCETYVLEDSSYYGSAKKLINRDTVTHTIEREYDISWTTPFYESEMALSYISDRGITEETARKFCIKFVDFMYGGSLLFPSELDKDVVRYFQVRSISDTSEQRRFYNPKSARKMLWANKIYSKNIAIVEGVFSGLSVYQHTGGDIHPLVLLGKSLTKDYVIDLKLFLVDNEIENIYLILDGGFERELDRTFSIISDINYAGSDIIRVRLPEKKDPNDMTKDEFLRVLENR